MRVMAAGTVMVDVLAVGLAAVADPGEVIYTRVELQIGGHPVDVAIGLEALGKDPDTVAMVAAVGVGPFGSFVRDIMDGYRFHRFLQEVTTTDTGRNLVLAVEDEDRRFHLDPGANWELSAAHVASAVESWSPDLVTLRPGYSGIDLELQEVLAPLDSALVMLDVMQPHPARPADLVDSILAEVDILHCNEREALISTGTADLGEAVDHFLAAGVKLVLVTAGEDGARAFTDRWEIGQDAFQVQTIDATGCGDAFCAGVILHMDDAGITGLDQPEPETLAELLLSAQATGACAATAVGCVAGVTARTRDRILAEQREAVAGSTRINERRG